MIREHWYIHQFKLSLSKGPEASVLESITAGDIHRDKTGLPLDKGKELDILIKRQEACGIVEIKMTEIMSLTETCKVQILQKNGKLKEVKLVLNNEHRSMIVTHIVIEQSPSHQYAR
jgi:hypothetical protein